VAAVTGGTFLLISSLTAPCLGIAVGWVCDPMNYIAMVMSIGLLVVMPCTYFRYLKAPGSRKERSVEMLRTMGASVLLLESLYFLGLRS
jgi:hypothetical protein